MLVFTLVLRCKFPQQGTKTSILTIYSASFCAVMIGYDSAFIGGTLALNSFKSEFNWSQYSKTEANLITENIVSLYQAGAFFGAFFAYAAGHYLGRKKGLQIFSGVFILGAGLMLGANGERGLGLIYAGRVLAGIGVGAASNLTPIYISELAPPAIRGRLVGLYELGWQVGGVVGFWINVSQAFLWPRNLLILKSMVFLLPWRKAILNGSFLSRFRLSRLGSCSLGSFSSRKVQDGS